MSDIQKHTTIKVNDDIKDRINTLVEELGASSQKDAMDYLLGLHAVKREVESGKEIPRITDMKYHFARIEGIFTEFVLSSRDREVLDSETISILKQTIEDQKIQLYDKSIENSNLRENYDQSMQELTTKHENEISVYTAEFDRVKGESALVKENTAKELKQMEQLVEQYKESKEQAEKLVKLAQEASENAQNKLNEYSNKVKEYDLLQQVNEDLKNKLSEIKDLLKEKEYECKEAKLAAERNHLEQVSKLREELASQREIYAELKIESSRLREAQNK